MKKSEVKVNDVFSFHRDDHCWHLHQVIPCKDKNGAPSTKTNTTYHPNLKQVCEEILDKSAAECSSAQDLLMMLKQAQTGLVETLGSQLEKTE